MLVRDGHFCPSLKTFPSSLQTDQIFFKSHFSMFFIFWSQPTSFQREDNYKTQTENTQEQ